MTNNKKDESLLTFHNHHKHKNNKPIRLALVLGAGGVRGIAHAGVIEVLEENNIPIDLIVGCSAGSVVGAMYAYYQKSSIIIDKLVTSPIEDYMDVSWPNVLRLLISHKGLCDGLKFHKLLQHQLPSGKLEDLDIPLKVVVTDVATFSPLEISTGNVVQAVLASSALPPYFSPVSINDRLLIDGAISSPVPIEFARKYKPKMVLAVNITQHQTHFDASNMLELAYRSFDITYAQLADYQCKLADLVIHPEITVGTLDSTDMSALYHEGRKEAQKMLPKIKEMYARLCGD